MSPVSFRRVLAPAVAALVWVSGCKDDSSSVTAPEPSAAVATTTPLSFTHVSAGATHTCGVTTESKGYCWGWGGLGELGAGTIPTPQRTPVAVAGNRNWTQVIAGWIHTCGVTASNAAFCWGFNSEGQNGNGTTSPSNTPTRVSGNLLFAAVTTGTADSQMSGIHSCGLTTAGRVYCWGLNEFGELGDGTTTRRLSPVAVVGP